MTQKGEAKTMKLEDICDCKKSMRGEIAKTGVLEIPLGEQTTREYQTTYYQCGGCQKVYYKQGSALKTESEQLASSRTNLKLYTGILTAKQLKQYAPKHKGAITRTEEARIIKRR